MKAGAGLDTARLTVALDVRHPFAYLALGPAVALGRELDLAIDWLPLASQTLKPPSEPGPRDDRSVRHRRHRAHMIAREIAVYAGAQGLVLREPYRDGPADAANLAWLWVRAEAPGRLVPFLEALFRRYWEASLDPDDRDALAGLLRTLELEPAPFLAWASGPGAEAARRVAVELAEAGLVQAPAYRVEDQIFHGRQHLPMIRWLLTGRPGRGPI